MQPLIVRAVSLCARVFCDERTARIRDYYTAGDDKIIFRKALT